MSSSSTSDALSSLLQRSFPSAVPSVPSDSDASQLSTKLYPDTKYTDAEKAEIDQWTTTSSRLSASSSDGTKTTELLQTLNNHLSTRTTLLGSKPSVADIALYARIAPIVAKWTPEERTGEHGYHHIVRHLDFVQNASLFGLKLSLDDKVKIDVDDVRFVHKPLDPKEEKERKRKEKAAAAGGGGGDEGGQKPLIVGGQGRGQGGGGGGRSKKEKTKEQAEESQDAAKQTSTGETSAPPNAPRTKKEKQPKPPKQAAKTDPPLSPSLIDLRVGHILKATTHPNAELLYVSTIACGDREGADNTSLYENQVVRTVCSGLNGLIPLSEMQDRKVIVVCNLKPVTMRGVKSAAMVLAASPRAKEGEEGGGDGHGGPVELVRPPEGAVVGERVWFEGWEGEPLEVLNPKKKIWEACQVGFTTTQALEVGFEAGAVELLAGEGGIGRGVGRLVTESGGVCRVESLRGAVVR
ncbi:MAG: G4 quadruplex nucleic acid binding protein [Candelina submexicana]|nr:MAG: G4 quadruplex nucleic acid binding protein [Candelina submexicana]